MVMDPSNDFDCINEISFSLEDIGNHSFMASLVETAYDEEKKDFSEGYSWKAEYQKFLAFLSLLNRFPQHKVSVISRNATGLLMRDFKQFQLSGPLHPTDAPSGPCIPGQQRLLLLELTAVRRGLPMR